MKTDFETLKLLASFTINHLKEDQMIDFKIDDRASLIDALATELGVSFSTDEDIRDQALEEVEEKLGSDAMTEDSTESEVYNHARKEIIKSFNVTNLQKNKIKISKIYTTTKKMNFIDLYLKKLNLDTVNCSFIKI